MTPGKKLSRVNRGSVYALRFALLATVLLFLFVTGNLLIQSINAFQSGGKIGNTVFSQDGQATNNVTAVAWSPVGDRVVAAGKNVQIWDALTGAHPVTLNTNGADVTAVAWSPDAQQLVTGSSQIVVWNVQTNKQKFVYTTQGQKNFSPESLHVNAMEWSPDKTMVATAYTYAGTGNKASTHWVDVWNAATGKAIFTYRGHKNDVVSLAWSSDSKRIASASTDGVLVVWDAGNGKNAVKYATTGKITSISWSPDDKYLVSATKTLQIWDIKNPKKPVGTIDTHTNTATSHVRWSPDGAFIVSTDTAVHIWNATSGNEVYTYSEHHHPVKAVAWSPDATYLVSSDAGSNKDGDAGSIKVWQAS
ncbi:hypothetical protein KDA_61080 [Dictyobacter alpinus]|uniref:Uncharacterized protein n=1 Tax=Dictyobacter alpinus TaxID=2014873 RepID=A0A402BGS1_9CHLR|nr:WD40 repeat domain-containing protein [Dictyobacter alpinus]GCE30624.1 hypothetical protein KDA_61080 [Dictyobacter alpinus]